MSNYPNRPFFYSILSAFRPYATHKPATSGVTAATAGTTSHSFSTSSQTASQNAAAASSTTHAQITQAATARAIASKSSSSGQAQSFAQAAAAFSPPTHHHAKHHATTGSSPGKRTPYAPQNFGGGRARRGSDSSGDEGFVQRPGADKWLVGGKMGNGEERFYKLSMARRERSNDRKSCDRMSL